MYSGPPKSEMILGLRAALKTLWEASINRIEAFPISTSNLVASGGAPSLPVMRLGLVLVTKPAVIGSRDTCECVTRAWGPAGFDRH
jgi:hypothetical protein